jgi:hypothetical protein
MPIQTVTLTSPVGTAANWAVPANVYRINIFLVSGGCGGFNSSSSSFGGNGGSGGFIRYVENISVTPGTNLSYVIGAGGGVNGGTGGTTSIAGQSVAALQTRSGKTILGSATTYLSNVGGSGANGDGRLASGGNGYLYPLNGQFYGGGGGAGTDTYDHTTARAVIGRPGGVGGGGAGGGEGTNGQQGVDSLGGGGGGGSAGGTAVSLTAGTALAWTSTRNAVGATSSGRGGSGAIVISYDVATFTLTSDKPGVGEGDTISFTLRTVGVPNGTAVPYSITGTNVTVTDFAPESTTGNFVVTSTDGGNTGTATVTLTINSSAFTEGEETATITAGGVSLIFKIGDSFLSTLTNVESTTISRQHYNNIRNPLVAIIGAGSADSGWNMPIRSSEVSISNKVSFPGWSNLRFDIINAWIHLYGSAPPLIEATISDKVRANNTNAPYLQYQNFVNNIVANKFGTPHVSQSVTRTTTPGNPADVWARETTWPNGTYGSTWRTKISATVTAVWSSATAARYFFNTGGEIRFSTSRVGGTSNAQGNSWTNLLSSVGIAEFGGAIPNQGTTPSNGLNYYRLTNNYQVWFRKESTTPYSTNYFRILARSPNFSVNTSGQEFRVDFLLEWVDDYVGSGGVVETGTDGSIRYAVSTVESFQVLQPAGSGNLTVETPTFTLSNPIP